MIYNQSLFQWEKGAEDERDYTNFHYIGNAFLDYELTEENTMLTYTLKKTILGEASTLHMMFYFMLEETGKNYVSLIPTEGVNSLVDPVVFPNYVPYTQRRFNLYSPHGYYLSEEIALKNGSKGAFVQCLAQSEESTHVRLFARIKESGQEEFGAYEEAAGLSFATSKNISHLQYAVSLNTTDGKKTPSFSDVRIIAGEELAPEPYTEKTAETSLRVAVTQKMHYAHGEGMDVSKKAAAIGEEGNNGSMEQ